MRNFKFRVLIQHDPEAVKRVKSFLMDFDIGVYDVREAIIVNKEDQETIGNVNVLCCQGSAYNYLRIKKHYTNEIVYEDFRTLY